MNDQLKTDFEKLSKAIGRLSQVLSWPATHDGRTEAAIQCFEIVVELYWKTLKHMLSHKDLVVTTPRDVFKESFAAGWIGDEDLWLSMLRDRNLTSHTYNEDLATDMMARVLTYLPIMTSTYDSLKTRAEIF